MRIWMCAHGQAKADADAADGLGYTALHTAVRYGHTDVSPRFTFHRKDCHPKSERMHPVLIVYVSCSDMSTLTVSRSLREQS